MPHSPAAVSWRRVFSEPAGVANAIDDETRSLVARGSWLMTPGFCAS